MFVFCRGKKSVFFPLFVAADIIGCNLQPDKKENVEPDKTNKIKKT